MLEGYVKAVHFATCTLNEDIDFKCCWYLKLSCGQYSLLCVHAWSLVSNDMEHSIVCRFMFEGPC